MVNVLLTEQRGHKADAAAQHCSTGDIQLGQHGEGEQGQANDVQQLEECDLISDKGSVTLSIMEGTINTQTHYSPASLPVRWAGALA